MMTHHRARLFGGLKLAISLLSSFLCTAVSPVCSRATCQETVTTCHLTALHCIAWSTEQSIDLTEVPLHCYALLALTHTQCTVQLFDRGVGGEGGVGRGEGRHTPQHPLARLPPHKSANCIGYKNSCHHRNYHQVCQK